jgi:glycosyltransferase involved in cell wall biosynthesis
VSEHAAAVIKPFIDPRKCSVIPHGAPETTADQPNEKQILKQYGIQEPFFLYLSILDPYKHQLEVLEGFRRIANETSTRNHQLVLAGNLRAPYGPKVREAAQDLADRVVCPGEIPRNELPTILRRASVLLFASTCEACPNILLEYLSAGRPILCSDAAPMPEFGGDAVRYVSPLNPEEWARGLAMLAADSALRQTMADKARQRATEFTWEKTAKATLDTLTVWS